MSLGTTIVEVALATNAVALILTFIRLLRGPELPDRVMAFDLLTIQVLGIIAATAILTDQSLLLDVAVILALLTFLATLAFARHVERTALRYNREEEHG